MKPQGGIALELVVGGLVAGIAGVGNLISVYDITFLRCVIAGLAGFTGAYCFLHKVGFILDTDKFIAIATGGGIASLFGPLAANTLWWYFEFIPKGNFFVDGALGFLLGLLSTPILALLRNPMPAVNLIITVLPWGKK